MTKAKALPRRTYRIDLTGELDGYHVVMAAMRARDLIALRRGEMDEADVLDFVAERCLEHNFGEDLRDLDYWMLIEIMERWTEAQNERALPPPSGEPSPPGSPE